MQENTPIAGEALWSHPTNIYVFCIPFGISRGWSCMPSSIHAFHFLLPSLPLGR